MVDIGLPAVTESQHAECRAQFLPARVGRAQGDAPDLELISTAVKEIRPQPGLRLVVTDPQVRRYPVRDRAGRALDPLVSGPAPATILVPTPSGTRFTQATAVDLAQLDHLVIACGRYEGIDARVWQHYRDTGVDVRELSIGDHVLAGGGAGGGVLVGSGGREGRGVGMRWPVETRDDGRPMSVAHPVPGKSARPVSWIDTVSTRGSSQKIDSTPSPWCTSTST